MIDRMAASRLTRPGPCLVAALVLWPPARARSSACHRLGQRPRGARDVEWRPRHSYQVLGQRRPAGDFVPEQSTAPRPGSSHSEDSHLSSAGGTAIAHRDGARPALWAPTSDGVNSWVMLSNVSDQTALDPPCALAGELDLGTGAYSKGIRDSSFDQVGGEFVNYTVVDTIPADKSGDALVDQDETTSWVPGVDADAKFTLDAGSVGLSATHLLVTSNAESLVQKSPPLFI